MNRLLLMFFLLFYTTLLQAKENDIPKYIKKQNSTSFYVKLLDVHARIYPDLLPDTEPVYELKAVPRNYTLGMQLAVNVNNSQQVSISIENLKHNVTNVPFPGTIELNKLLPVHVEGNTQGSMINVPGGPIPNSWIPYLIRVAPFTVLEAVEDSDGFTLNAVSGITTGALLQIQIPVDCAEGVYSGTLKVSGTANEELIPFSFKVHKTVIENDYFLDSTHWLSELPENLKSGTPVAWWSEEHWKLLERAGKLLRKDGSNMMFTPLINTENSLIQSYWDDQQKKLVFDYSRFDRWVHTFDTLGYKYFAGRHIKFMAIGSSVNIKNLQTNAAVSLSSISMNLDCYRITFLEDLYRHLEATGMKNRYVQHIFDEPAGAALSEYTLYDRMKKKVMPDIKSIDAINSAPQLFSDMVDIQVFNLPGIILQKNNIVQNRLTQGRGIWLYNTSSPYPPYPNRHTDARLVENRLWPWLCLKYNASGYLFWAANEYRGVPNEYLTSLGPMPNGSQNPGHPPGDAWLYYRTANGIVPSMRIVSFREGMIDASLWAKLKEVNPVKAQQLMNLLIFPEIEIGHNRPWNDYHLRADEIPIGYEASAKKYHDVRAEMLELLDAI